MRPALARGLVLGAGGLLLLALVWEGWKALGPEAGVVVGGVTVLPRTSAIAMPHLWEIAARLGEPVTGARNAPALWSAVLGASAFSLGIAAVGWVVGTVVGLLLALLMQRFRTAESAVLPWIVLSQTVPLIAIAPLVRRWGSQLELGPVTWENWMSVALIASYLAFFPVSIGALRGLGSPTAHQVELMHVYGVGWWKTLVRLRLPASVPYLLPALRLGAVSAVVGTIVAEVSIGLRGGIGRMIIEFASAAGGDPAKPWAPILGAVLVGLAAAGAVALLGTLLRPYRRGEQPA
ncbi:ABC transporter permease [Rathayibacter sp. AY1E9]|jgi:NitT/TauT family transport system permease protein|uniref:ABC transporter permease n=1 Tax=unclassified Rathayibacter TaxID=2609250 RepID=UPI000CE74529|nr:MULTISPECIES: ABC transporter permease subunit [unclassified Rathayibacter]PPF16743.1 ABC transporter permease [Rathayibacter sp. AY1A4]PPF22656.1 ABC transporter permease [Rathayibacter sp. AY1A7]PPF48454.1 ABC transporter permease [Rathayibacter sp. AY1A1]PPG09682.1 ABC transporter permease [Rathayibacter sp. AY2B1]PPG52597.1 ABC transporter permease [Rathayibacter sp. AY1E9]